MDEAKKEDSIPTLTLDPGAATAAAVETAPAPTAQAVGDAARVDAPVEKLDMDKLSPAEQAAVKEFAAKIDVMNTEQVMNYGAAAQKNVADFSESALNTVRTKDLGEAGGMLSGLVVELKGLNFDESQKKGFMGLFRKSAQGIETMKAQYSKAEVNVDKIVDELNSHEITLMKDVAMLDKMYEKNLEYQKELTMYILAGKLRAEQLRGEELPRLQQKARESNQPEDAQAANDFANMIGRFEKKLNDLELTRMISIQMAPQIRLVQNNDNLMAEKIQSSIVNTIPLWKSQMVLALSMYHSEQATKAQHEVNEVTNELLQKNAEKLHEGSVAVAKESERGIVDIETLQKTNQELISTLDEVRQIQDDGRAKRAQAEQELGRIEGELKQKLLEIKG